MPKDSIADDRDQEQILKGIQPKHQLCYKAFKIMRLIAIFGFVFAALMFGLTFVEALDSITANKFYRLATIYLAIGSLGVLGLAIVDKLLFLRKAPFDDWVFEIAEKRLGTSVIFYDSKHIYLQYDRGGKEVDKKEFVTEMSDKSVNFSYYYVQTFIDKGVIMVQCKKRAPIPNRATFKPEDDKYWNAVPMGLTINNSSQKISPFVWYMNTEITDEELCPNPAVPAPHILICGGTGCFEANTPILLFNTLIN